MSKREEFQNAALDLADDQAGGPASPDLDPARYAGDLDGFDLTDVQKQELLATLWSIMRSFVELGFRADVSAQILSDAGLIPSLDKVR